jgi:F0F1-type ATP synthase assembly protein I
VSNPEDPEKKAQEVSRYMEIGMAFPACLVAGLLIGYGLDKLFGTHFWYLVCMLLGIAGAFIQLLRLLKK